RRISHSEARKENENSQPSAQLTRYVPDEKGKNAGKSSGWGTWIRTRTNGVRVRWSTVNLFPKKALEKPPSPNGSCILARSRHRQRSTSRRSWLRCSHRHQLVKPVSSSRLRNWPPRVHRHESIQVLSSWSAVLRAGSPSPMPHCNIKACVSLKKPPYAAP